MHRTVRLIPIILLLIVSGACQDDATAPPAERTPPSFVQIAGGVGESRFLSIWGTGADSLLGVGVDYPLLHSVGRAWSANALPTGVTVLSSVWGRAADDVLAVGAGGVILHFDGTAWTRMDSGTPSPLTDVRGIAAPGAFAVGGDPVSGTALAFDGTAWSPMMGTFPYRLNAVWAYDARSVFVAGNEGYIARFDGRSWTAAFPGALGYAWHDAWGVSADEAFFVGDGGRVAHYNNGSTTVRTLALVPGALRGVSGFARDDVWAVGDAGVIAHFDGTAWSLVPSGTTSALDAIVGLPDGRAVAAGADGIVLLFEDGGWSPLWNGRAVTYNDMWGSSMSNVFAVGRSGASDGIIHHIADHDWTFPGNELRAIFGFAPADVWAGGRNGFLVHFDGHDWSAFPSGTMETIAGIHGVDDGTTRRIFMVGSRGLIRYSDGSRWAPMVPPDGSIANLLDVWAAAPDNAFAVGELGSLYRYRGPLESIQWTRETLPVGLESINAVAGRSAYDVVAVTETGRIFHFDGTRWVDLASETTSRLLDVSLASYGEGLIVGEPNTMLQAVGMGWIATEFPYLGSVRTAWSADHRGYLSGSEGSVFVVEW